jgi:glycosyltransferase involved in cell wall biosynthesis
MKTIAIFEFFWGGHRSSYLNTISKVLLELGYRVIVCSPKPGEVKPFGTSDSFATDSFHSLYYELPDTTTVCGGTFGAGLKRWIHLAAFVKSLKERVGIGADFVFINFLDSLHLPFPGNMVIDTIFPCKWGGLYVQPCRILDGHPKSIFSKIYFSLNPFSVFNASRCDIFAILNETVVDRISGKVKGEKVVTFPDFVDASLPAFETPVVEELRKKARGRTIVGLFGKIKKYKGIFTFIETAKRCLDDPFFFIIAGDCTPSSFRPEEYDIVESFVGSNPENSMFVLDYISDEKIYNSLINASDVVFAAFEDFPYSSNTVTKAAVFKKPIIVSDGYCMANRIREYHLGRVVEQGNVNQVAETLNTIRRNYADIIGLARFDEFAALNSIDRLKPLFTKILGTDSGEAT